MDKLLCIIVSLFFTVLTILSSCSNDEPGVVESDRPVRGYLKGQVNEETIDVEQKELTDASMGPNVMTWKKHDGKDSLYYYAWASGFTLKNSNRRFYLFVALKEVKDKMLYVIPPFNYDDVNDEAQSEVYVKEVTNPYPDWQWYKLKDGTVFKVWLDHLDVTGDNKLWPLLEGHLEGTVYNTENPDDSISFKDISFRVTHW